MPVFSNRLHFTDAYFPDFTWDADEAIKPSDCIGCAHKHYDHGFDSRLRQILRVVVLSCTVFRAGGGVGPQTRSRRVREKYFRAHAGTGTRISWSFTESSQLAFHFRFIFYVFTRLEAHNGAAGSLILNMTPSVLVYM